MAILQTEQFPWVTVGLFTFNGSAYLRETLESLVNQSYPNFRICISDNASTDGTGDICQEFVSRLPGKVNYVRQPVNRGAIANGQFLLNQCRTEYFMWAGDHDQWSPNYVDICLKALLACPTATVAYTEVDLIDADGAIKSAGSSPDRWSTIGWSVADRYQHAVWQRMGCIMIYGLMRTAAARSIRQKRILGPDNLFITELLLKGDFVFCPTATIRLRDHRTETSDEVWNRQRQALHVSDWLTPWFRIYFEHIKLVLRFRGLSFRDRWRMLTETIRAFHFRFHDTLQSESPRLFRWNSRLNRLLGILRKDSGAGVPH